jgi:Rrf2 family iron-sulfur cluster assembly transcriptional regulator
LRLSTKARYAVMAMVDLALAESNAPVSLSSIAERQGLPLPYLEQLFAKLRKAGLISSIRGATGGYRLAHPAENVRVFDIITAVDHPLKATRCDHTIARGCQGDGKRCTTHDLWEELGHVVQLFLKRVTLADIRENRVLGLGHLSYPLTAVSTRTGLSL